MLERYLRDLEREMSRSLSGQDLQVRLDEAEAHLRDGVEARIELGLSPEEAACEAVASFGAAGRLSKIAAASVPSLEARMRSLSAYWWLFVPTILWSGFAARSMPDALVATLVLPFVIVAIGFGLVAFRSGRPNPVAVLRRSVVALGVGAAILFSTHVVYETEGYPDMVGRTRVADRVASYEGSAEMALDGRLRDSTSRTGLELATQYRRFAVELRSAADRPLANVLPTLHLTAIFGVRLLVPPLAFDLVFGGLGALALRMRNRRRPSVA